MNTTKDRTVQRIRRQTRFGPDDLAISLVTTLTGEQFVRLEIGATTDLIDGRKRASVLLDRTQIASLILGLSRAADELPPVTDAERELVALARMNALKIRRRAA